MLPLLSPSISFPPSARWVACSQSTLPRLSRAYAAKAQSLKERLAELIPKEIENVRTPFALLETGEMMANLVLGGRTRRSNYPGPPSFLEAHAPIGPSALARLPNQVKAIRKEHGNKSFGEYTVDQAYGYVNLVPPLSALGR